MIAVNRRPEKPGLALVSSAIAVLFVLTARGQQTRPTTLPSLEDQLIRAAFHLDVATVQRCLDAGANVNARFGRYDAEAFRDKWFLGYSSLGSKQWTALMAVADSNRAPDPQKITENTSEGLDDARRRFSLIEPRIFAERNATRVEIARLLLKAGADIDAADYRGNTALASACYNNYEPLALLLIDAGAKVNTKTGIYIDGTGDITPAHRAADQPQVLAALIAHGVDVNATDTTGQTPLHWAVRRDNAPCVKMLLAAKAAVAIKDERGCTPLQYAKDRQIQQLLRDADAQ